VRRSWFIRWVDAIVLREIFRDRFTFYPFYMEKFISQKSRKTNKRKKDGKECKVF
jgi:hypothetical protein